MVSRPCSLLFPLSTSSVGSSLRKWCRLWSKQDRTEQPLRSANCIQLPRAIPLSDNDLHEQGSKTAILLGIATGTEAERMTSQPMRCFQTDSGKVDVIRGALGVWEAKPCHRIGKRAAPSSVLTCVDFCAFLLEVPYQNASARS